MSFVKTWFNIRTIQTQAQINSHLIPRLDPINSKSGFIYLLDPLGPLELGMYVCKSERPLSIKIDGFTFIDISRIFIPQPHVIINADLSHLTKIQLKCLKHLVQ